MMNRIYRLVWNQIRRAWTVASELARRRGKGGSTRGVVASRRHRWLALLPLALPVAAFAAAPPVTTAMAGGVSATTTAGALPTAELPTGGTITAGRGHIDYGDHTATITQSSERLSLNWLTFDIGAQDTVDFLQPDASAIAVNRIADPDGSVILGHLDANGQVFLINPNGVLFGEGAQVNVGGLVASTLDVDDASLGSGTLRFTGDGSGRIVNQGAITAADGGYIALLGNTVSNQGALNAHLGSVALGAGSTVTLHLDGDALVGMQVDASTVQTLAENRQLIVADGGQVLMSAGAKDSLLASVVNNTGVIQAHTVENRDGHIVLLGGMAAGTANVDGTLDASAPGGGDGGFVETSASHVKVADSAHVTAQSAKGDAGTWLLDPIDFTVAASGGDITGATLGANLAAGDVTIKSTYGQIYVDDAVNWNADTTLTLTARNNIYINADLTATGDHAGLVLMPNTTMDPLYPASGTGIYTIADGASITLSGAAPSLSIAGTPYTVINGLGVEGDTSITTLQGMANNLDGHYALGTDIDASATSGWNSNGDGTFAGFDPIGNSSAPFTGVFDGLGHTIGNLDIGRPSTDNVGLFGYTNGSAMRNVGLIGGSVVGRGTVGGLVGHNNGGAIDHAYVTGSVSGGGADVGGLVGYNLNGAITQDHATGAVTGNATVGGLVGSNDGDGAITQAYATGTVVSHTARAGGLVGLNTDAGTISQAYASGTVTGVSYVGGLAGANSGAIDQTYATGTVTGTSYVGGLAGSSTGTGAIAQTYATGAITGTSYVGGLVGYSDETTIALSHASGAVAGSNHVGGLVGDAESGSIDEVYASGDVTGTDGDVGGLVGYSNGSAITHAYATGAVTGDFEVGGLVGSNSSGSIAQAYATGVVSGNSAVGGLAGTNTGTVTDGYWDKETTGQVASAGSDASSGLTTTDMIDSLPAGFDAEVWGNVDDRTTPYLLNLAGNQVFNVNDLPVGTISPANPPDLYTVVHDVDHLQAMLDDLTGY
ncbi:MAG TPA: GLUG motif-containing protein, partial [Rhodanobacteraceae bacterium]|nr:GLUG motif-containing protein [Rhodanobacteraceae bacterium]